MNFVYRYNKSAFVSLIFRLEFVRVICSKEKKKLRKEEVTLSEQCSLKEQYSTSRSFYTRRHKIIVLYPEKKPLLAVWVDK